MVEQEILLNTGEQQAKYRTSNKNGPTHKIEGECIAGGRHWTAHCEVSLPWCKDLNIRVNIYLYVCVLYSFVCMVIEYVYSYNIYKAEELRLIDSWSARSYCYGSMLYGGGGGGINSSRQEHWPAFFWKLAKKGTRVVNIGWKSLLIGWPFDEWASLSVFFFSRSFLYLTAISEGITPLRRSLSKRGFSCMYLIGIMAMSPSRA